MSHGNRDYDDAIRDFAAAIWKAIKDEGFCCEGDSDCGLRQKQMLSRAIGEITARLTEPSGRPR